MAIRRVSDLPDLLTTYKDDFSKDNRNYFENIQRCLLEVSYDHQAHIYLSFSLKTKELLDILIMKMDERYVTLSTDLTITGAKTFTKGLTTNELSIFLINNSYNGMISGITHLSADIRDSKTNLIPSPKAVHDYVSGYAMPLFDPSIFEMLCSLVSDKTAYYYVDYLNTTGKAKDLCIDVDIDWGKSEDKPFKTLSAAIKKLNKRRFIGKAKAYIRLISDYCASSTNASDMYKSSKIPANINIYHPDMILSRLLIIQCGELSGNRKNSDWVPVQRTLSVDSLSADRYEYWFRCYCNVEFQNCTFDNGLKTIIDDDDELSTNYLVFYTIAGTDNLGEIKISNCYFKNCYYPIHANIINVVKNNRFYNCIAALHPNNTGIGRSSIAGTVCCIRCNHFIAATVNALVRYSSSTETNSAYLALAIHKSAFTVDHGASILLNFDIDKIEQKNKCFWLTYYVGRKTEDKTDHYALVKLSKNKPYDDNVLNYLFNGHIANGYDDNGYIDFSFKGIPLSGYMTRYRPTNGEITTYLPNDDDYVGSANVLSTYPNPDKPGISWAIPYA